MNTDAHHTDRHVSQLSIGCLEARVRKRTPVEVLALAQLSMDLSVTDSLNRPAYRLATQTASEGGGEHVIFLYRKLVELFRRRKEQ